jgi:lipoprotein NlpI
MYTWQASPATVRTLRLFMLLTIALNAHAGDTPSPKAQVDAEITQARVLIDKRDWAGAAQVLTPYTATNPKSADGFNLLGYSLRHLNQMDASFKAYQTALSIDPQHKGAHEYIGVAYLKVGNIAKAEEHLQALDKICWLGCEEFRDLKKAIAEAKKDR